jgi:hypothetical protein
LEERGRERTSLFAAWNNNTATWSCLPWATTLPPASTAAPPAMQSDQQGTASSAPWTLLPPHFFSFVSCLMSSCIQNDIRYACRRMRGKK